MIILFLILNIILENVGMGMEMMKYLFKVRRVLKDAI
jgi:hypothetical protein